MSLKKTALACILPGLAVIAVVAGLVWWLAAKGTRGEGDASGVPSARQVQETPTPAGDADAGGRGVSESSGEAPAEPSLPTPSGRDPRVVEYEQAVASFERDAAAFRAAHPVYEEFLGFVRQTLVPMYLEGQRANVDIHKALNAPLDYAAMSAGGSLGGDEVTLALLREAYDQYGRELWDQTLYGIRGGILGKYLSEFTRMAESKVIVIDDAEMESLRRRTGMFERQRLAAIENNWPAIEELIPDKESLHYKLFIANRADVIATKFFMPEVAALPAGLEARRREIDETRRGLIAKRLMSGPAREYHDAYYQALWDEVDRAEEFMRATLGAERELRAITDRDLSLDLGGLEDE